MTRGAKLSTDHNLVVSWIRWQERLTGRPGKPNLVVGVNSECLAVAPVRKIFNSRKSFSCILGEDQDVKSMDA